MTIAREMMTGAAGRAVPPAFWPQPGSDPVEWSIAARPVAYDDAVAIMEARVEDIAGARAPECVWLLEHPSIYTRGTSALDADLVDPRFPVHRTGRGGRFTYHGPGQRVVYVMLDLRRRRPDIRAFVSTLEDWIIGTLAGFSVEAERRADRIGVWVPRPGKHQGHDGTPAEDKIAAVGVRLRRWVSFHGLSINLDPDLSHFDGIVPCGLSQQHYGITSLVDLGHPVSLAAFDRRLRAEFERRFGPTGGQQPQRDLTPDPEPSPIRLVPAHNGDRHG